MNGLIIANTMHDAAKIHNVEVSERAAARPVEMRRWWRRWLRKPNLNQMVDAPVHQPNTDLSKAVS